MFLSSVPFDQSSEFISHRFGGLGVTKLILFVLGVRPKIS
jgi:hypothetical protein